MPTGTPGRDGTQQSDGGSISSSGVSSDSSQPAMTDIHTVQRGLQLNEPSKRLLKRYRTEVAASSSSLLSTLAAFPLDSVKTRMQIYKFNSAWHCFVETYRSEGVHGFWRGVLAPLASITLVRTISFSVYQRAKYTYDDWIKSATGQSPLVIANTKDARPTLSTITCFGAAGGTAGAIVTLIACPFELTKTSAQIAKLMAESKQPGANESIRRSYEQKGTLRTAVNLVRHRGILGLYSGLSFHLARDTIGTAVYFMTYESAKQLLANARGNSPTTPSAVVIAGGLCGLVSWACIYPIDSAKSIYQRNCLISEKGKTTVPAIEFFNRRMYRGLGVSMSRSAVTNAVFFSAFEAIKKRINALEIQDQV